MAYTRAAALGLLAATCVVVTACSSSGSGDTGSSGSAAQSAGGSGAAGTSAAAVSIDVGTQTLHFPAHTKPKVAMFAGSGIAYQTAYHDELSGLQSKFGVKITYFDSKFDPTTQLNQIRSAIQSKKYNAFMVENYSGASACTLLTKQAPAAGIVVSQLGDPTCEQATAAAGTPSWSKGTLNTIGADTTVTYYTGWVREAKAILGAGNDKVAVLNGPPLVASTTNMNSAMSTNGLKPVANVNTDYTTPTALTKTASILQAHSDVDAIFSVGPDVTVGIVSALKQAGKKPGQVKVFEVGGAKQNKGLIEQGWLTMSVPYTPKSIIDTGVSELVNAFNGKQGKHFLPALNKGTADAPYQLTKKTVGSYTFEY